MMSKYKGEYIRYWLVFILTLLDPDFFPPFPFFAPPLPPFLGGMMVSVSSGVSYFRMFYFLLNILGVIMDQTYQLISPSKSAWQ